MSDDFRYDAAAHDLDDKLEEVIESHAQEKQENEGEQQKQASPQELSALERIARGGAGDEVAQVIQQTQTKSASAALAEHRVRSMLRDGAEARRALVDNFLTETKAQ